MRFVVLFGSPWQNNLMEMWALFNFVAPDVLGEPADFRWALNIISAGALAARQLL